MSRDSTPSPIEYSDTALAFRDEIRAWLTEHSPAALRDVQIPREPSPELETELKKWADVLTDANLMCVAWPTEYGGRGLSAIEVGIMNEEFERARVPRITRGMGETLAGPAIIKHATAEQKAKFLPPIIAGEHVYCQGFSEPGAGSDLAGLTTSAVIDGDNLIINGQKVWTSGFFKANMIFTLVRTNPDASKHNGISYVLVPLTLDGEPNGIEFRPIKRITGLSHFAETFFTDAVAPLDHVIGGLNNGWQTAMTTLSSERGATATTQYIPFMRRFWDLVRAVRERGDVDDPAVREQLAWMYSEAEILRYSGLLTAADLSSGGTGASSGNGSSNKIRWSEYERRMAEIAMEILGPQQLVVGDGYALDPWQEEFLVTRSHTIWGGTAEVQRNIIGERVLGLPKEPRVPDAAGRTGGRA